jgi:hypothetical protein
MLQSTAEITPLWGYRVRVTTLKLRRDHSILRHLNFDYAEKLPIESNIATGELASVVYRISSYFR